MSLNDLHIASEGVISSANEQKNVSENFTDAVNNVYATIETICSSEWLGYSSQTFDEVSNSYKAGMLELGVLIDEHAQKDIKSAHNLEDADNDAAANARRM